MFLDKTPITSEKKISFTGIFDIKETYSYLKKYLDNSKHFDVTEKELIETNQGSKRKIDSHVEASMQYNDYFKVIIKYRLEASGNETTINHEGKKICATQGTISIKVNSFIQNDWQNKRGKSSFSKFIDQVYNKYVGKNELDKCAEKTSEIVSEFVNEFKKVTNIYVK